MISEIDPSQIVLQYMVGNQTAMVPFSKLDDFLHVTIRSSMVQGLAIGCCILLIFLSWFIIINKKTPIFFFHQCCLLLLAVRSSLYLAFLLGPLSSVSYFYTGLFYGYWRAFRVTQAVNAMYVILITAIEIVFVFQTYVIFRSAANRIWSIIITCLSASLGIVVVVVYIITISHTMQSSRAEFEGVYEPTASWENNVPFILFAVSLNLNSVVLISKLAMAIRARRVLGLKQFDALHILLIMSVQTCLAPSIMVIYNFAKSKVSSVYFNISLILVVCSLPFSSLWASSANNSSNPNSCQNTVLSSSSDTSSQTITFSEPGSAKMQKFDSPISGYDRATLAQSVGGDTDSIERIIDELKETP